MMKRFLASALCLLAGFLPICCVAEEEPQPQADAMVVGTEIAFDAITEFVYTRENINYNASYQRYRFYVEEGRRMFAHEARQRENDYGPATEADITRSGAFECTEAEWTTFCETLRGGSVCSREDEPVLDGDDGPWTYLYWIGDPSDLQVFSFGSWEQRSSFEDFCAALAEQER